MPTCALPPSKLAEALLDDEIHVWSVDYPPHQGRAPLRRVLATYLACEESAVALVDDTHGRPALEGEHALRFNWSHSGAHALIAVATGVQPGIDLEQRHPRRRRDVLALAQRFFAGDEAAALARVPEEEREFAFLRMWTAKEALLKAHGRGLAFGLDRVRVEVAGDARKLLGFSGEDLDCWQLQGLEVGAHHVASLAWRGSPRTVRWMSRLD